jgi:predicted ester cyclase
MRTLTASDAAKAVVRRSTEEVQGKGRFDVFEELFADDFVDHTPQPNMTADKVGVRKLYGYLRDAFPDFHARIHWQLADGDRVTTYKTYYGTHEGPLLSVAPTHRKIHFESVDVMRVQNGQITDHLGSRQSPFAHAADRRMDSACRNKRRLSTAEGAITSIIRKNMKELAMNADQTGPHGRFRCSFSLAP